MKYSLILLTLLVCPSAMADQFLVLGILEEPQCKEDSPRSIRPLFAKSGDGWVSLDTKAKTVPYKMDRITWTLAFDGKSLGQLVSIDPRNTIEPEWTYSRDYLHKPDSGQTLPQIKNKTNRFGGWCGKPQYFPIVLVSKPYFTDPDQWKRSTPDNADRQRVFPAFKNSFEKLCIGREKNPTQYGSEDLRIIDSYTSKHGEKLISATFIDGYYECDEVGSADHGYDKQRWFFLGNSKTYLSPNLTLIDAGDYDNDGKSEALFWYDDYNQNGYVLFYDGFRKRADFLWSYH